MKLFTSKHSTSRTNVRSAANDPRRFASLKTRPKTQNVERARCNRQCLLAFRAAKLNVGRPLLHQKQKQTLATNLEDRQAKRNRSGAVSRKAKRELIAKLASDTTLCRFVNSPSYRGNIENEGKILLFLRPSCSKKGSTTITTALSLMHLRFLDESEKSILALCGLIR